MQTVHFPAGTGNRTPELVRTLLALPADTALTFDRAEYHFYAEGCYEDTFYPLSNKYGPKRVIFPLLGKKNVRIDGGGATFIFHDRVFPCILQDCEDVTLSDFTVDCADPRYFSAVVHDSTDDYLELRFDRARYRYEVTADGHMLCRVGVHTVSSAHKKIFLSDYDKDVEEGTTIASMKAGDCPMSAEDFPADGLLTDASDRGDGVVRFTFRPGSPRLSYVKGHNIVFHFDEDREYDTFFANRCKNLTFDGVTILRGPGMGLIAQLCETITLDRVRLQRAEGRGDLVSVTADGFQFGNCRGTVRFTRSVIANTLDDAVNMYGIYTHLDEVRANELSVRLGHREQYGVLLYRPGDEIRVVDGRTLAAKETRVVVSAEMTDGKRARLVLDRPATTARPDDYIENVSAMAAFEFTDNTVDMCPSVLISTSNPIRFLRNRLHTRCAGLRLLDSPYVWYGSSRVCDALIEDNDFVACGEGYDECVIKIFEYGDCHGEAGYIHNNIRIVNNRFSGRNPQLLTVSHAEDVSFTGNSFRRTAASPFYAQCAPVTLAHSRRVVVKNNNLDW